MKRAPARRASSASFERSTPSSVDAPTCRAASPNRSLPTTSISGVCASPVISIEGRPLPSHATSGLRPDDLERHDGHGRSRRRSAWRGGRRLAAPTHGPQDRGRDGRRENGGADPHGRASPPGGGGFACGLDRPRHRLRARYRLSKLAQVDDEITHALIAAVRILGQALAQYSLQLRAGGHVLDTRRRRHLAENRADRVGGSCASGKAPLP